MGTSSAVLHGTVIRFVIRGKSFRNLTAENVLVPTAKGKQFECLVE
jgi:hypothetical protein